MIRNSSENRRFDLIIFLTVMVPWYASIRKHDMRELLIKNFQFSLFSQFIFLGVTMHIIITSLLQNI